MKFTDTTTLSLSLLICQLFATVPAFAASDRVSSPKSSAPSTFLARAIPIPLDPSEVAAAGLPFERVLHTTRVDLDLDAIRTRTDAASQQALGRFTVGWTVSLELLPGVQMQARGVRVEADAFGVQTWVGIVDGPEADIQGFVTLSEREEYVVGTVEVPEGHFQIRSGSDGAVYAQLMDTEAFPQLHPPLHLPNTRSTQKIGSDEQGYSKSSNPPNAVDLVVLYTTGVAAKYDPVVLTANAVTNMNLSFSLGGVDWPAQNFYPSVRVVGYRQVSFDETQQSWQNFYDTLWFGANQGTGALAALKGWRDTLRNDITVWLLDQSKQGPVQGACGVSPVASSGISSWNFEFASFAMVGDDCALPTHTFTHEVGHALAARHQWGDPSGGSSADNTDNQPPGYTYNHGYLDPSAGIRTIMGVGTTCSVSSCPRLNRWSNPDQTWNSQPLGVPEGQPEAADNRKTLRNYIPVAAGYQSVNYGIPDAPSVVQVVRGYCWGTNWFSWVEPAGVVGWYEAQLRPQSNPIWSLFYRGVDTFHELNVAETTELRVRACNASGCTAFVPGNRTATYTNGCL